MCRSSVLWRTTSAQRRRTWPQKSKGRWAGPVPSHGGASGTGPRTGPGAWTVRSGNGLSGPCQRSTSGGALPAGRADLATPILLTGRAPCRNRPVATAAAGRGAFSALRLSWSISPANPVNSAAPGDDTTGRTDPGFPPTLGAGRRASVVGPARGASPTFAYRPGRGNEKHEREMARSGGVWSDWCGSRLPGPAARRGWPRRRCRPDTTWSTRRNTSRRRRRTR